jgi:hypothetical protein
MIYKKIMFLLVALLIVSTASAHLPRLVLGATTDPVNVNEPATSYAFYGQLSGEPQVYKINMTKPFELYVGLLVPYTGQENSSAIGFDLLENETVIASFHDFNNWTVFYEEYGKDWYLQGPEYRANATAGTYYVKVYSSTNTEKYALATGTQEKWGAFEIISTLLVLPFVKALIFQKYTMLIVVSLVLAAAIGIMIIRYELRRKSK